MENLTLHEFHEFLGHPFSDLSVLEKALTAPGAEGDKDGNLEERIRYEGNRTLAQIGIPLHQLAVKRLVLEGLPREQADNLLKSSFVHLEERAKLIGFYDIIKLNPRQKGFVGATTLRLVFFAIIGAVYENCGRNESRTTDVVNRLYFNPLPEAQANQTTTLSELEVRHTADGWDDLINTPGSRSSSHSNDLPSLENSRNCWRSKNEHSQQGSSEISRLWGGFESPSQQQDGTLPTPSSQLGGTRGNFGDLFEFTDHNTSPSLDTPPPEPDLLFQNECDTRLQATTSDSDRELASNTAITATTTAPPLVLTVAPHPVADIEGEAPNAALLSSQLAPSSSSTKRRSYGQELVSIRLNSYIGLEKKRCLSTGLTFLDADLKSAASNDITSSLLTLYFGIGSPEVLGLLQELLKARRERFTTQQRREKLALSPADRIIAIEGENTKMAYNSFRKRIHVHRLYVDCTSESASNNEKFITSTIQTMARRPTPQIGNPQNLELSRISNRMLSLSYPGLMPGNPNYEQKKRYMNELRRLGQRLHLLVDKFGRGILGLIPLPSNEPSPVQALNITDEAILRIPDNKFKPFVDNLENRLGGILREMSNAVRGVVEAIFNEEVDPVGYFAIESCEQVHIVQYPRGSPELLHLIS